MTMKTCMNWTKYILESTPTDSQTHFDWNYMEKWLFLIPKKLISGSHIKRGHGEKLEHLHYLHKQSLFFVLTTWDRESSWFLFCVLQSTFKIVKLKFEFVNVILSNFANLWGFSSWSVAFKIQWNNCSNFLFSSFFENFNYVSLSKSQLSVYFSAAIAKTNITYLSN